MYIIIILILLFFAFKLLKKIGKSFSNAAKSILNVFKLIVALPAILCAVLFNRITKLLHVQSFIYYLLVFVPFAIYYINFQDAPLMYPAVMFLGTLSALLYLCIVHIPYSIKERFIDVDAFFDEIKTMRNDTIAMSCFIALEGLLFLYLGLDLFFSEVLITLGEIHIVVALIYSVVKISNWIKEYKPIYEHYTEWRKWTKKDVPEISELEIEEKLISASVNFAEADSNKKRFMVDEMPYGRATAFISYFEKNLDDEEPVYFSPEMSSDENELREYGTLVTTKGVYISKQGKDDIEIPFEGLWNITNDETTYYFDYGLLYGEPKLISVEKTASSVDLEILKTKMMDLNDIYLAMAQEKVITELDEALKSFKESAIESAQDKFDTRQHISDISKAAELGGLGAGLEQNAHIYNDEVKNYMNGARGGGYAAEYGNNAIDRLTGKKVVNLAQDLDPVTGRQKTHGADRLVNGVKIQTKYYKSASESIGAAFEHKKALYVDTTTGKMMQIEVPRDQYNKAVEIMRERIRTGQVPGETNPDNAKNYVRKGHWTYFQANNIALAGTIEGISTDISQGIVCSLPGAGITVVLSFASAVWHGQDIKEAAKQSTISGLKVMGKGVALYTLTMQLSRDEIANYFAPKIMVGEPGKKIVRSFASVNNPILTGANKIAGKINSSGLANSSLGKKAGLDKIDGRKVIGGTVTAVVVYGPDVCKAFQGKISGKQLIKNSTVNTAGMVGAALGTAIPIPVLGNMIGGAVASFVAKKIMDNFIEDDAVTMFRIMREEFLDIVMLFSFNKEEFNEIVTATIANPEMPKVLQAMYQSGTPKDYADALIHAEVQSVLAKREKITNEKIEQGMQLLLEDESAA
ncbi:MAG: hypothetical protein PUF61_06340 [Spirochaetales bacterium]|nr:hypothetical protein [Spirochaetales bacterium]